MEFLFSVFTPTYNRAGTIARAYNHLCKQTLRNFEWIVIDDGSTDNTEETIREWIKEGRIHIVYIKQAMVENIAPLIGQYRLLREKFLFVWIQMIII